MRGLREKVVVVVGAAPGNIGGAAATRLAEEGASVVAADISEGAAIELASAIVADGGAAIGAGVDISSDESYAALISTAEAEFGGVDGLFQVAADLSAGTMGVDSESDFRSIPIDVWNRTFDVNLTGYLRGARCAVPSMLARGGGSIVNTMSAAAFLGEPVRPAYGSAKIAIAGLTRHIASAVGADGVRCNAIAPGLVMTDTAKRVVPEEVQRDQLSALPSSRLGDPRDIAAAAAFLLSDDGAWINGQTLSVDGGSVMR